MKITEQSRFAVVFSVIVASLLSALALSACQRQPDESEATATTVSADIATLPPTPADVEPTATATVPTATTAAPTATPAPTVAPDDAGTTGTNLLTVVGDLGRFSTLMAAIDATSLSETLQAEGPFTFFAPTDEAFAALPEIARDALLQDPDALSSVLQNHLVEGRVDLNSALAEGSVQTMAGNTITVATGENGAILVQEFEVLRSDIEASNGLVHVVDHLLLPPGDVEPPVIDESGVPIFNSRILTVVGTAAPGTTLVITLNGDTFGETTVEADGTWLVDRRLPDGEHTIVAYTLDENNIPIARSKPVILISPAP